MAMTPAMADARAEARLRCIEAAARFPTAHPEGPAAGVLELAGKWAEWVFGEQKYDLAAPEHTPQTFRPAPTVAGTVWDQPPRPKITLPEKKK